MEPDETQTIQGIETPLGADAIREIERLTLAGQSTLIEPPAGMKQFLGTRGPDGVIEFHKKERPGRRDRLSAIGEIPDYLEAAAAFPFKGSPIVYVSAERIVVVLDENISEGDANYAVVELETTPEFGKLQAAEAGVGFTLEEFRKLLRFTLAAIATGSSADLLKQLNSVRFEGSEVVHSKRSGSRESLGREIENAVTVESGEIPTEFELLPVVYCSPFVDLQTLKQSVRCQIDVDPIAREITFQPSATDLQTAVYESLHYLRKQLKTMVECPVLLGEPSPTIVD